MYAGIYAAWNLREAGIPVVIVEAAPYLGGRTKAANFIHGERTFLADMARKLDLTHFDAFSVFSVRLTPKFRALSFAKPPSNHSFIHSFIHCSEILKDL